MIWGQTVRPSFPQSTYKSTFADPKLKLKSEWETSDGNPTLNLDDKVELESIDYDEDMD